MDPTTEISLKNTSLFHGPKNIQLAKYIAHIQMHRQMHDKIGANFIDINTPTL